MIAYPAAHFVSHRAAVRSVAPNPEVTATDRDVIAALKTLLNARGPDRDVKIAAAEATLRRHQLMD